MYKNVHHCVQSKSILVQLKSIAPCLVTKDLNKIFLSVFLLRALYISKGHYKVSQEPCPQAEQPHLSLPFFIAEVLQAFEHFHSQEGANRILQKLFLLRFQLCLFLIFCVTTNNFFSNILSMALPGINKKKKRLLDFTFFFLPKSSY